MALRNSDAILVPAEAIEYIEKAEQAEGVSLSKFEVVEHFFEWLKTKPTSYQVVFLKEALSE